MKNLPDLVSWRDSVRNALGVILNLSTVLLGAGILLVFVTLSWDMLSGEVYANVTAQRWTKGAVATKSLYSSTRFKVKLPSGEETEILPGERIISRGEKIDETAEAKIKELMVISNTVSYAALWGNLLIVLLSATVLIAFLLRGEERGLPAVDHPLLLSVIVGTLVIAKITVTYAEGDLIFLANPIPVALILLSIFATTEVATIVHIILVVLVSVLFIQLGSSNPIRLITYLLVGGIAGIFACSSKQSERADILRAGLAIGISNVLTITAMNLIFQEPRLETGFTDTFHPSAFGFFNGIACSMVVLGLIPILEDLFQVTTSTRYLELINPNHPLIQKMIAESPGTFHHSQNVAMLAEKAAEEIGADPYLAKAAAYYHDLGKSKRPFYFIENQMGGVNYHDYLSPQLSKLIIHSHTKDGVEIGRRYGLPKAITDIMVQHHGTDLVAFFYHRARQNETEMDHVDEESFRYPGVKPQTKEAAIIMLADAVEAATRTIKKPTPQSIENLISKIINTKFVDGQFDECNMTKRDFETLAQSLTKTIMAMYHSRIVYPDEIFDRTTAKIPVPQLPPMGPPVPGFPAVNSPPGLGAASPVPDGPVAPMVPVAPVREERPAENTEGSSPPSGEQKVERTATPS